MTEAFHIATSGRPGPVLVDVPKDISSAPSNGYFLTRLICRVITSLHTPTKVNYVVPRKYCTKHTNPYSMSDKASFSCRSGDHALLRPCRSRLLIRVGKGACPEDHPLHLGMLGMHGTAYVNMAVKNCDLIFAIGSRWDDRIIGKVSEFCADAVKIHLDIDPAEFNEIIRPDISLQGDAPTVIDDLTPLARVTPASG